MAVDNKSLNNVMLLLSQIENVIENSEDSTELGNVRWYLSQLLVASIDKELSIVPNHPYSDYLNQIKSTINH